MKTQKSRPRVSSNVLSFLLGSFGTVVLGGLAYSKFKADPSSTKIKFGTALDFQTAVRILCLTFPEEGKVTTDADDLYEHGVSIYDHHSGMYSPVHLGLLLF